MELEAILELKQLRYIAEDETRIGRKTEPKRVITSRGVKPKVKVQWPREAFWLYGVVEPLTGWQWTQEYRQLNQTNFQAFLNELSLQLGSTVAVMQMDRAPAHRAQAIESPENIIPIFQPPHSPELNPPIAVMAVSEAVLEGREFCFLRCTTAAS